MNDRSSSPDLQAIQARVDAATPGPWGVGDGTEIGLGIEQDEGGGFYFDAIVAQATYASERDGDRQRAAGRGTELSLSSPDADAEFIAHARTDVPALLALVAEMQGRVDDLTGQVAGKDETIRRAGRRHRRLATRLRDLVADLRTRDEKLLAFRDRTSDHTKALGIERSAAEVRTVADQLDHILTSLDGDAGGSRTDG